MKGLSLSVLLLFSYLSGFGQVTRCAADIGIARNGLLHEKINSRINELKSSQLRVSSEVLRIPVVVHVIHNNSAGVIGGENNSNISDEQIFSQIEVLNEDYRRKAGTAGYNEHPDGADMEIEFFLATIDPQGMPASGINRVYSSRRSFSVFSDLRNLSNLSYWDSDKYLNIWVTTISGNYLGYAEFPIGDFDGLESTDIDERVDGVFVDHRSFGRQTGSAVSGAYTYGRTATHEVGHWLGLIHTWGDARCGTDFCDDTPPAEDANNTLFCTPVFSSCRGITTRNMIENYLDYTPDSCMNVFTQDQKSRVRAILEISNRRRNLIANSDLFNPIEESLVVKLLGNPAENNLVSFQVLVDQPRDIKIEIADNLGRVLYLHEVKGSLSRLYQIPKNSLGRGVLNLRVTSGKAVIGKRIISI